MGTKSIDTMTRQTWRCPYEAPAPDALLPFVMAPSPDGYRGDSPTVCPGYSTSLPETIEIARGWLHWSKGSLRDFCGGTPPESMTQGTEVFAGAVAEFERVATTPRSKGGIADG